MGGYRDDEKRFVVRVDETLTAFLELERVAGESLETLRVETVPSVVLQASNLIPPKIECRSRCLLIACVYFFV